MLTSYRTSKVLSHWDPALFFFLFGTLAAVAALTYLIQSRSKKK